MIKGVTHQDELEEELDPETKEALKGIKMTDPKAKEFLDSMRKKNDEFRKTGKNPMKDVIADLKKAVGWENEGFLKNLT